jgi:Ca-activated chloride channel homolog
MSDWRLILPAVFAIALQTAPLPTEHQKLRSSIELTVVTATVLDADGHLVANLPREAFEIYEDGERQAITQFTNIRVPVGLGLLLDISDSMYGRRIKDARAAVERFLLELLQPTDAFFVMAFNHEAQLLTSWTSDPATVRLALDQLHPSGGTAIYDAVRRALPLVDQRTRERAALVVISDGADTASDTTLFDLRGMLLQTDAFIYAIAIDSPERRTINGSVNPAALSEITSQTGGHTQVVHDTTELADATGRIAEELNLQYMLGYSSPHPADGRYHSIRVKAGPGYRVRARNGYKAVSPSPKTR